MEQRRRGLGRLGRAARRAPGGLGGARALRAFPRAALELAGARHRGHGPHAEAVVPQVGAEVPGVLLGRRGVRERPPRERVVAEAARVHAARARRAAGLVAAAARAQDAGALELAPRAEGAHVERVRAGPRRPVVGVAHVRDAAAARAGAAQTAARVGRVGVAGAHLVAEAPQEARQADEVRPVEDGDVEVPERESHCADRPDGRGGALPPHHGSRGPGGGLSRSLDTCCGTVPRYHGTVFTRPTIRVSNQDK